MTLLISHPQRELIRTQLARNIVLRTLKPRAFAELEKFLSITDHKKGDLLLGQGDHDMAHGSDLLGHQNGAEADRKLETGVTRRADGGGGWADGRMGGWGEARYRESDEEGQHGQIPNRQGSGKITRIGAPRGLPSGGPPP